MAPASFNAETFPAASTTTSTGTNSCANDDVLFTKHSVAFADPNKLEMHSTNLDIAKLANVFHTDVARTQSFFELFMVYLLCLNSAIGHEICFETKAAI